MNEKLYNIAIDGPSGAGKTTIAQQLSKILRIVYLDTGAMYRACALYALDCSVDLADVDAISSILNGFDIDVKFEEGKQRVYLKGRDVSQEIRQNHISKAAAIISKHACVRQKMVELQRNIASQNSCILDGRDIGTQVLPNAKYKFFLTADASLRAKRRHSELLARGESVAYEQVLQEIESRDFADTNRKISPLKKAADAIEIDSTNLGIDEVLSAILSVVLKDKEDKA